MIPEDESQFPFQDPQLPVEQRVADLLARMPLEDKAGLLFHDMVAPGDLDALNTLVSLPSARTLVTEFHLRHFNLLGALPDGRQFAQWHNQLQRLAAEQPLAVPVTLSQTRATTSPTIRSCRSWPVRSHSGPSPWGWPQSGPSKSSTSSPTLPGGVHAVRDPGGELHPQIDLATEPGPGRGSARRSVRNTDLTCRLVMACIQGFQGESLGPDSVATMAKHFPGGGPQKDGQDPHFAWGREQVYPGGYFDYHLRPFRAALAAGTSQIMPYYGMPGRD